MNHEQSSDVGLAFDKLKRDARGVGPVELHRFIRSRLPDLVARQTLDSILIGALAREQLTEQLGLASGAITAIEFGRLSHMLSLWYRWASDDADMAAWISSGRNEGR